MNQSNKDSLSKNDSTSFMGSDFSRKSFLKYAGASAVAVTTFGLVGCDDDDGPTGGNDDVVNLGSGDVGVLNYAYALEQLEAAFYIEVMNNAFGGMSAEEGQILADLRDHEVAHRDFFQTALGDGAIPGLTPNFSSIDFSDRGSVLASAQAFEDTGVSAYNGAARFVENIDFLVAAGKIVSVEARHAAAIRDLINPRSASFAGDDIIDNNGLELTRTFDEVLAIASNFVEEELDGSNLPTTPVSA